MSDRDDRLRQIAAMAKAERYKMVPEMNIPEYQKRDIIPADGGRSLLHDASGKRIDRPYHPPVKVDNNMSAERVAIKGNPSSSVVTDAPLKKRQLNPGHSVSRQDAQEYLYQPRTRQVVRSDALPVHIGVHAEHRWYDDKVTGAPEDAREYIENNYVNVDAVHGVSHNDVQTFSSVDTYNDEEVPYEDESYVQDAVEPENDSPKFDISSLNPGEYAIVIGGDLVLKLNSAAEVSSNIESIMMEYKIPLDLISVFNRLSLSVGVLVR